MIVREREIWMYYTGDDTLHGDVDTSALGLARVEILDAVGRWKDSP